MEKKHLYWDFIREEAKAINSDGCSKVVDFRKDCCLQHDLAYFYGRCSRDAYRLYLQGRSFYWQQAKKITRSEADSDFKDCYRDKSVVNGFSPFVWTRYFGVRLGGWNAWRKHRKERP